MAINVQVSETYDLSTKVGKLALLGIHTPTADIVKKCWPGLLMQCKYVRPISCDVVMACASMLPADPLQVGTETGQVSPADMFNPIIYKAVSNDAMNTIEGRIHSMEDSNYGVTFGPSVKSNNNSVTDADNTQVYYGLLSDRHGWRHAMPQQGLEMHDLRPLVYSYLQAVGIEGPNPTEDHVRYPNGKIDNNLQDITVSNYPGHFRGNPQPMPRIPCTQFTTTRANAGFSNAISDQTECGLVGVPPIYVAAIVMPPAKLTTMYYRLHVTWTLEFSGLRSQQEICGFRELADMSTVVYHSDYAQQASKMTAKAGMADVSDADLKPIMQG